MAFGGSETGTGYEFVTSQGTSRLAGDGVRVHASTPVHLKGVLRVSLRKPSNE